MLGACHHIVPFFACCRAHTDDQPNDANVSSHREHTAPSNLRHRQECLCYPKRESNVHFESNCKTRRFDRPHRRPRAIAVCRRRFSYRRRLAGAICLRLQFLRAIRREQRTTPRAPPIRAPPHRPTILEPNPNPRAARKFAASSRRINSGAACNTSGGASATRTGISPSNKNSPTARRSKTCRATNSSPIFTRPSASRIVSVLSQDVPRVRFFPSSAQAEEDVSAAKAATEVAQLVERNNRIGNLIVDEAFNLWTDGKVGAYVRFVVDGQRFGFHPETEIAAREVKIGEDVYVCPDCGEETPSVAQAFLPVPRATNSANRATQAPNTTSLGSAPNAARTEPSQLSRGSLVQRTRNM